MMPYFALFSQGMQECTEKGFDYFCVKDFTYSDESGLVVTIKADTRGQKGESIKNVVIDEEAKSKVEYELLCFHEKPTHLSTNNVPAFNRMIAQMAEGPIAAVEDSEVLEINSIEELNQFVASANTPVFVDCYSDNCPPCKILSPMFDKFSKELSSRGKFLKVNLQEVQDLVSEYNIKSMPTLLIFDAKGKLVDKRVGLPDISGYFLDENT